MVTEIDTFTPVINKMNEIDQQFHPLQNEWTIWAHLPHNTDWSTESYINLYTVKTIEESVAFTETLPDMMIENCMLFLMKKGIKPVWEDPKNRGGGCFSYKILNKNVPYVWKKLSYCIIGNSVSNDESFVNCINGITISPKKNFCIIKIWLSSCNYQNPMLITNEIKGLSPQGCIFKKHTPEY
jgi:hypothetical protein